MFARHRGHRHRERPAVAGPAGNPMTTNYPLTEDDFDDLRLPASLREYKNKLFGLTIDPERLSAIRNERRANSPYSSLSQCQKEVRAAEAIRNVLLPYCDGKPIPYTVIIKKE